MYPEGGRASSNSMAAAFMKKLSEFRGIDQENPKFTVPQASIVHRKCLQIYLAPFQAKLAQGEINSDYGISAAFENIMRIYNCCYCCYTCLRNNNDRTVGESCSEVKHSVNNVSIYNKL